MTTIKNNKNEIKPVRLQREILLLPYGCKRINVSFSFADMLKFLNEKYGMDLITQSYNLIDDEKPYMNLSIGDFVSVMANCGLLDIEFLRKWQRTKMTDDFSSFKLFGFFIDFLNDMFVKECENSGLIIEPFQIASYNEMKYIIEFANRFIILYITYGGSLNRELDDIIRDTSKNWETRVMTVKYYNIPEQTEPKAYVEQMIENIRKPDENFFKNLSELVHLIVDYYPVKE